MSDPTPPSSPPASADDSGGADARSARSDGAGPAPADAALAPLRQRIDQLDAELVRLLNERAELAIAIGKTKRGQQDEDHPPLIYAPHREQAVLKHVREQNQGPLKDHHVEAIFREIMSGSFDLQRPLTVAFLGPEGSFSQLAAVRQFGSSVAYTPSGTISRIFHAVQTHEADLGIVPIENSIGGGVVETLDAFRETELKICNEILIEIHHHLLVHPDALPADGKPDIEAIHSHPQVFHQCSQWLAGQYLDAQRVRVESTAAAARAASENPKVAAIASRFAGQRYGLTPVVSNIEDNAHNVTRFFVIARESARPTGDDKTALMFTAAHEPGSLVNVLDVFRKHRVNLTHIDKRPLRQTNWEYYFFIDCEGHQHDGHVAAALEEAATHCHHLSVLGSFPRATEPLRDTAASG